MEVPNSILKTLSYADIFDYPLTKEEIWNFLISEKKIKKTEFEKALPSIATRQDHYFFLKGRQEVVSLREKREKVSKEKLELATKYIRLLSLIPWIKFIGISGSLSMQNAVENDDIDLFVITSDGGIWTSRLLMILLLLFLGKYRRKDSKKVRDLFCLNMFITQKNLEIPKNMQNLYTAHEVVQLMPIFSASNTYEEFISANSWVGRFLTHYKPKRALFNRRKDIHNFPSLEKFSKRIQLKIMKDQLGDEVISDKILAFHPFDNGRKVLDKYDKKLEKMRRSNTRGH